MLYPGDTLVVDITIHYPDTGGLVNADTLTVTLRRNGLDTAVPVSILHVDVGIYTASAEIPEDWEQGDSVWFLVTATVGAITANAALGYNVLTEPPIPITVPISDPGFVTGYLRCYDNLGDIASGIVVNIQMVKDLTTGFSYPVNTRSVISDAVGIASFPNLVPGAVYKIQSGLTKEWLEVKIPLNTDPVPLNTLLRHDA